MIMGLPVAIGALISSATSFISATLSTTGAALAAIGTKATALLTKLGPFLEGITKILNMVGGFVGILKPNETVEDLGAKVISTDKKPDDFDSINAYIDHLKNEVMVDKEKVKDNQVTKVSCIAIGSVLVSEGIAEKLNISVPMEFWKDVSIIKLNPNEIVKVLEKYKECDVSLDKFTNYVNGNSDLKDTETNQDILCDAFKELEPSCSNQEIERKVMKMENMDL